MHMILVMAIVNGQLIFPNQTVTKQVGKYATGHRLMGTRRPDGTFYEPK